MLGTGKYAIRIITYSFIDRLNQLDHTLYHTIYYLLNQKRYVIEYNCEYFCMFD